MLAVGVLVFWQGVELVQKAREAGSASGSDTAMADALATGTERRRNNPLLAGVIGLAIGTIGGAVGLILGSLRLPALIRVLGLGPRIAAGTNMFIGFAMGASGWVGHVIQDQVDYPLVVLMALAAIGGVNIGARHGSPARYPSPGWSYPWASCCSWWARSWSGAASPSG